MKILFKTILMTALKYVTMRLMSFWQRLSGSKVSPESGPPCWDAAAHDNQWPPKVLLYFAHFCTCIVGIPYCCVEWPHRVGCLKNPSATATYQAILSMYILSWHVWNQNYSTIPIYCIIGNNLRQRSHPHALTSEDSNLIRKNFLHRMLFKNIY